MVVSSYGTLANVTTPPATRLSPAGSISLFNTYRASYATIYRTQPEVRKCVDFIARNCAQLGLHAFRRLSDTERVRLTGDSLSTVLRRPSPYTTRYRLFESLFQDWGIYFNAFLLKVRTRPGLGLARLPPDEVEIEGGLFPTAYVWRPSGGQELRFDPSEIIHVGGYDPTNPLAGLSPLETLRRVLAEEIAARAYREGFWRDGAHLAGVIQRPATAPRWDRKQKEQFVSDWQALYSGPENAGKSPVLEDGMTWASIASNAKDAELVAARKLGREEVASAYHIPLPMVGILDHATFCLPCDALVLTEEGPKSIASVRADDRVWSLTEAHTWALSRVARSCCSGYDQVLTIKTANRTVRMNARHRVLARRAVDVPAPVAVMADGHRRAVGRATKVWQSVYVPAAELRVGDTVVALRRLPEGGSVSVAPSGRVLTVPFMELCGLVVGDGNVTRKRGEAIGLQIARSERATYMEPYRAALATEFTQRGGRPLTIGESQRQTRVMSVSAGREMDLLGFGGTAHTKRVPGWVFQTTESLRLAFLRGFLDADGSCDRKGRLSFSSCNEVLLSQVRHLCLSVGVPVTNLRCQRGITTLPNGRRVQYAQWNFTCSDPGQNRRIGSHTPAYLARLSEGQPFGRKSSRYPWHGGRGFDSAWVQLTAIRSIERSAIAEPVYDLEVEGTHNFVANGVVVHNSNIKEQHKHLYQDCLGPPLVMTEEEFERQLVPEFYEPADDVYLEFNIQEKLKGSFEEQVSTLRTAIGKPFMAVNEGRARLNLPPSARPEDNEIADPTYISDRGEERTAADLGRRTADAN